ncbi:integrase core domain-containing protein [Catellatospora sp. NPDC049111]|uniref:integrase core domain-containing protein n=1 Tax=Catellatospora sp. NPDC049111 TaxID=3155271 RepID=UPI0033EF278F
MLDTTSNPDGFWTVQATRNLLMDLGERVDRCRFLVRDRGGQFTDVFDVVFAGAGIEVIKTPPRCPRANAFAERWVRTLRSELTDRMLIFGERHLRHVLTEYVKHYNHSRPHRALNLSPPRPLATVIDLAGQRRIRRKPILGGLINEYERAAQIITKPQVPPHRNNEPLQAQDLHQRGQPFGCGQPGTAAGVGHGTLTSVAFFWGFEA